MQEPQCFNAVRARVVYQYLNHPGEVLWNGEVVSNNPPVIFETIRFNEGTVACGLYVYTIVVAKFNWSEPGAMGEKTYAGTYYGEAVAYGPLGLLSSVETTDPDSYNGFSQTITLQSRGLFGGGCQPFAYYSAGIPTASGQGRNRYLYDTTNMRIEGIRRLDSTELPPCRFTVTDGDGLIYDRIEKDCPAVGVICEGYCAPGGSRIGGCCVDCSDLRGNLEAIRQAVRRL